MKGVVKNGAPASLEDWLSLENEEWKPTYGSFSGAPKHQTHEALLKEQGGVCVYCGKRLSLDRSDSHIEHFRPQTTYNATTPPDLTLEYYNLIVSCGPNDLPIGHQDRKPVICGEAKSDWFDENEHVHPADQNCPERFSYGLSGAALAADSQDGAANRMIEVLRLNDDSLVYERGVLLTGLEEAIVSGEIDLTTKEGDIAFFQSVDDSDRLPDLGHVAVRYLQVELL